MSDIVRKKTIKAFKWSSITEIVAKLISPCMNMILARILAPEAFGMVATISMVISFSEIFSESGFQKFLIQHDFRDKSTEDSYFSVAFWSNLSISLLICILIVFFRDQVSVIAGNGVLGLPIAISSISIPVHGMVGIQSAKLKKNLEFKRLFYARVIPAMTPLFITLPLAVLGLNYWSLVVGNLASSCVQLIVLYCAGGFVPKCHFSFREFKHMMSFGMWTLLDGLLVWTANWIDALLISNMMSDYLLGLYRNSTSTVTAFFTVVTSAITPVMFSSLAKLQKNEKRFNEFFLTTQKYTCVVLLPVGMGLFLYRDFVTYVLFGPDWMEASIIVGVMALANTVRTLFISLYSDAYRAKGNFYVPLVLQLVDVSVLIPACVLSLREGFLIFIFVRGLCKIALVLPEMFCVWKYCKVTPHKTIYSLRHIFVSVGVMTAMAVILQGINENVLWNIISILLCAIIYILTLSCFKEEREKLLQIVIKVCKSNKAKRNNENIYSS